MELTPSDNAIESIEEHHPSDADSIAQGAGTQGPTPANLSSNRKRHRKVFDILPWSSDSDDDGASALIRERRRRQSSPRFNPEYESDFRPLDILICEDHAASRTAIEKLLEALRCRTITASDGVEAMRYAMSEVKFDIIMMEFKLPAINGYDVARMIRTIKNTNLHTPIVAITGYLKEIQAPHCFDGLVEKPPTLSKLTEIMVRLCRWKAPAAGDLYICGTEETRDSLKPPSHHSSLNSRDRDTPDLVRESHQSKTSNQSNKGGRPRKDWTPPRLRLLVRFVTTAFSEWSLFGHLVEESGFKVKIRTVQEKVKEMFGPRVPSASGYDAKLRPDNSKDMNWRVNAFLESRTTWEMLREKKVSSSAGPIPSAATDFQQSLSGVLDNASNAQSSVSPLSTEPKESILGDRFGFDSVAMATSQSEMEASFPDERQLFSGSLDAESSNPLLFPEPVDFSYCDQELATNAPLYSSNVPVLGNAWNSDTALPYSLQSALPTNLAPFSMQRPSSFQLDRKNQSYKVVDIGITDENVASFISGRDPVDRKWLCLFPKCNKRFYLQKNIKLHVRTHFSLPCKERFVRQDDLKLHTRIHSGPKPYQCICGNSFARSDALTGHRQRGLCIGAFEGVVKNVVERGRPRKENPQSEPQSDGGPRAMSFSSISECSASSYGSHYMGQVAGGSNQGKNEEQEQEQEPREERELREVLKMIEEYEAEEEKEQPIQDKTAPVGAASLPRRLPSVPPFQREVRLDDCDECKRKKRGCDGEQPCAYCTACSCACTYHQRSKPGGKPIRQQMEMLKDHLQHMEGAGLVDTFANLSQSLSHGFDEVDTLNTDQELSGSTHGDGLQNSQYWQQQPSIPTSPFASPVQFSSHGSFSSFEESPFNSVGPMTNFRNSSANSLASISSQNYFTEPITANDTQTMSKSNPSLNFEDWRNITDPQERKKAQRRQAQRAFRAKRKRQLEDAEGQSGHEQQRFRVRQACEACRRRKWKCSGTTPCSACIGFKRYCTYSEKPAKRQNLSENVFSGGTSPPARPAEENFGKWVTQSASQYPFLNFSRQSSNSSFGLGSMGSFGNFSQASLGSPFSQPPSRNVSASNIAQPHPKRHAQDPPKEGRIKRFLRSKYNPFSSAALSTLSFQDAQATLEKAGVGLAAEQRDLYNICFALSAEIEPLPTGILSDQDSLYHATDKRHEDALEIFATDPTSVNDINYIAEYATSSGNSQLHSTVVLGLRLATWRLLELGADPWKKNNEGMNSAIFGWYGLEKYKDDGKRYADVWRCMLMVFQKQQELRPRTSGTYARADDG